LVINPNPVRVTAIVKHPVSPKGAYLRLFDFTGKSVKVIVVGQNITQTSFSVKGLASGIYELVWKDDTRELRRTLMISQ
jgi:hypothetical protein